MMDLFESTTDLEQTTEQSDLSSSDTIETPAESETAQQTEATGDTSQEETTPALRRVSLKLNDADYDLDLPDEVADTVKNGILMQADYTKSKQELSDQKKALQSRGSEIDSALAEMRNAIEFESEFLESEEMKELKEEYPDEYARKFNQVQDKVRMYNEQTAKRNKELEESHKSDFDAEQAKYAEAVPEWLDESVKKSDFEKMGKYIEDNGFSQDEINSMYPAKFMKTLRQAALYEQALKSAQSKKKTEPPASTSPGTTNGSEREKTLYDMFSDQMKK